MRQKRLARLSSDPDFRQRYGEAHNSYRDERVRAVFAMAPRPGPVFTPESLGNISIPVAIVTGRADDTAPPTSGAEALAKAIPHATLKLFPQAGHYVFWGTCTTVGSRGRPRRVRRSERYRPGCSPRRNNQACARFFHRESTLSEQTANQFTSEAGFETSFDGEYFGEQPHFFRLGSSSTVVLDRL
jgi:predicted dienelactone hydrolase